MRRAVAAILAPNPSARSEVGGCCLFDETLVPSSIPRCSLTIGLSSSTAAVHCLLARFVTFLSQRTRQGKHELLPGEHRNRASWHTSPPRKDTMKTVDVEVNGV